MDMEEKKKKAFDLTKLKKENFVVIFLAGILLLVIAWPVEKKENNKEESKSGLMDINSGIMEVDGEEGSSLSSAGNTGSGGELQAYTEFLEQALSGILSDMEGAGRVKVMITMKASGESIVEKDTVILRSSSTEVDSEGGSRNMAENSESEETIYTDTGNSIEIPFVKQIICPQIEGVLVCAEGGGSADVNKNIIEAIQALFGIEAHKIKVIKMSSK